MYPDKTNKQHLAIEFEHVTDQQRCIPCRISIPIIHCSPPPQILYKLLFSISLGNIQLTNKKAKTVLCSVINKARKEVTRARKKCRVNTSRKRVLLPTSWVLSSLPWVFYHRTKHGFGFFYLFYNIALLTFVKKLAFNCKKSSFFIACKRAQERFSACQRAQNDVKGYSMQLYSDKTRCFNQSQRALYRNFIIISLGNTNIPMRSWKQ